MPSSASKVKRLLRGIYPRLRRYGVAVMAVAIALSLKLLLASLIAEESPFLVFFAAIIASALYGGMGAGVLATVLAALTADYFFLTPTYSLLSLSAGQNLRLVLFVLEGLLISKTIAGLKFARRRVNLSQQALNQSEERYRLLVDAVQDYAIFLLNPDGSVASWNTGAQSINGYRADEIIGRHFSCFYPEADIYSGKPAQQLHLAATEGRFEDEGWRVRKDGSRFWANVIITALRDPAGIRGFSKVTRDISDRKFSEEALRQSEERYRAFIEQSSEGIWRFELEQPISIESPEDQQIQHFYQYGYLAECNNVMAQMYGFSSAQELVGAKLSEFLVQSDLHNIKYLRSFIRSGYRLNAAESHEVDQQGLSKYFLNNLVGIIENGVLVRAWGSQVDVTERHQLEDALKQKSIEREVLLNSIPALVYYKDRASNYIAVNQTFAEIISRPIEEIPGKTDFDFFPLEQAAAFRKDDREVMESGDRQWHIEELLTGADGKTMWVATSKTPYRNSDGEITGMVGITIDITERKLIEEALRERETRHRLVARATNDAIWDWDLVTNQVEWNEGVETLFGYWATDVGSDPTWWYERIHPEDRERVVSGIHQAIASGEQIWTAEYRYLRADNSYALVIDRGLVAYDEQGKPVRMIGSIMDITSRKQIEAELRLSEARFRMLLENVKDYAIFLLDTNARVVHWSAGAENILGYGEVEILGQPGSIIFTPEDLQRGKDKEELNKAVNEGQAEDERWHVRKDSTSFWASGIMTSLRDETGQLQGFAKIMRDFTERKQLEEEREQLLAREQEARAEAEAANRMKDEFLATLSHELRTPLNAMIGWTNLLRTRKFDEKTTARALETIDRNTKSLFQLIEDVLDVSRIITGKLRLNMSSVELGSVIEAAIETVLPAAEAKSIQIVPILNSTIGSVLGDANRLQQVFWNLLSNAVKFTPKGGRVEARLEVTNSRVQIRVSDTGLGIAPEFLPYVFERFRQADSTTTRSYGGLGLGLAVVRHLVELHGGTVDAESPGEGQGATFIVNLPLRAVRLEVSKPIQVKGAVTEEVPTVSCLQSLAGVRVLVVDDELDARELLTTALGEYGAEVIAVATAGEAIDVIKQLQPNVLVSDIGMPEEDGYALIRRVRVLDPKRGGQIPAVALTAYARAEDRTEALLAGFQQHVSKPVDPAELAVVVANLTGCNDNLSV